MKREDAEEFTQSLGQIVGGSWRQIALARRLGVPHALGLSVDEWVRTRLGGYIRLSIEDRREAVKELTDDGHSQRQVGEVLGIDHKTVSNDLRGENSPPNIAETPEMAAVQDDASGQNSPPRFDGCEISDLNSLVATGRKFGTIYADPPWLYENQATRAATSNHYPGLTVDELCALPVQSLADDDAHLHLWTTNAFLFECPRLFAAWGFEFRSTFVWCKPQMGIGNYWRNSHEILLTAIRGNAKRFRDHGIKSWVECDRGGHSDKPDQVRAYIERASQGPYLELFARRPAPRWTVWGNEIEKSLFSAEAAE